MIYLLTGKSRKVTNICIYSMQQTNYKNSYYGNFL
jgi:hypothetical protein